MKKAFKPALITAAIVQFVVSIAFFIGAATEEGVKNKFEHGLYGAIMVIQFFPFIFLMVWVIIIILFHVFKDEFSDSSNKRRYSTCLLPP